MELFQKLTLYDLLGYTLPGSVLIGIYQWNTNNHFFQFINKQRPAFWIIWLLSGYLLGIIMAEVTDKLNPTSWHKDDVLKGICEACGIKLTQLVMAYTMLVFGNIQMIYEIFTMWYK